MPYCDGRIGDFFGIGAGAGAFCQNIDYPMRSWLFQICGPTCLFCVRFDGAPFLKRGPADIRAMASGRVRDHEPVVHF